MNLIEPSLLIASNEPKKLAQFYSHVCESDISQGLNNSHYVVLHPSRSHINIYKPSRNRKHPTSIPSGFSICFQKPPSESPMQVIQLWIKSLIDFGAQLIEGPNEESFGVEAWFLDPENNKFLIYVPRSQ